MKKLILILLILPAYLYCNEKSDKHISHAHKNDYEIGLGIGDAYSLNEKGHALGLHFHLARNFQLSEMDFSVGLSYELIGDEHLHQSIGVLLDFTILENVHLVYTPGILFVENEFKFSNHLELSYGFELGEYHLGPTLGYAIAGDDEHVFLGLHLGYGF